MSSLPLDNPHYEDDSFSYLLQSLDDSWPVLEESNIPLPIEAHNINGGLDSILFLEQENSTLPKPRVEKELLGNRLNSKNKEKNHRFKCLQTGEKVVQPNAKEGSIANKVDHNAKERLRRMKLHASYLALGSLLPDSPRTKKRWCAPVIIDRVLEYVPKLENEIEKLTLKKDNMISVVENKQLLYQNPDLEGQVLTVSVHEVKKGEVIVQICMQRDRDDVFSNLIRNVEAEGMCIVSASTLSVCDGRVCYHLHTQINGSSIGADYTSVLREKVISWLC